ncbi:MULTISPECIES: GNAT family N-acetyltransferase [Paenibacillus]|uniref:GNAT family N-acetyltransferase n=1 Tax=Paenibacillus TaxID=44249 RepID=UPI000E224C52|nr:MULTISPECIES: GNAT family protein [Paenibacillus]MCM2998600.1 GNAT family N-acetyltransferase [Paenibacillus cellulositrophicus]RED40205.1 RimJ/RimL family protein N-acetyltransferase [Paenibacillus sp. VMFN-D1]
MNNEVILRDVNSDDLPIFFEQQLDKIANHMAAFTAKDPTDNTAFMSHWHKILDDDRIIKKTVLFNDQVAGHVSSFEQFGEREVSYWIGREYWGRGIATRSLSQLLDYVNIRPLFARSAKDNTASIRVLEKCGFKICGEDKGFSNARAEEVEEYVFKLPSKAE